MNILEKLNAIKNQEITAKENVEAYIKVIEEKNDDINAFLELNKEEAIAKAEEIDAKIKAGEEVYHICCIQNPRGLYRKL